MLIAFALGEEFTRVRTKIPLEPREPELRLHFLQQPEKGRDRALAVPDDGRARGQREETHVAPLAETLLHFVTASLHEISATLLTSFTR